MISLLRRIRKSLIGSGSVVKPATPLSRYLLYAIGEIALVVIGILIALQINSWNSKRINRNIEREYIVRLTHELKSEVLYFERVQSNFEEKRDKLSRIVKIWYSDNPEIEDSLQYFLDFMSSGSIGPWYNEPTTWTQMIQTGDLKLIRDQILVQKLFAYYNAAKKQADNFAQHPMNMNNEARRILPTILIDENLQMLFGTGGQTLKTVPDKKIYDRIWNQKDELTDLFVTIAFISNVNYFNLGLLIESANDLIDYIESNYHLSDFDERKE